MTTHPSEPIQEMLNDPEGQQLVHAIHDRKRLADELAAADLAHTLAVSAAAGNRGTWEVARAAASVVHQTRAALKAAGGAA